MRINARLSGSMLRIITLRDGYYPEKGTPVEESAKRAKRHLRDKCDSLLVHCYQRKNLCLSGWGLRFLTLTFAPDPQFDLGGAEMYDYTHKALKRFVRSIKKHTKKGARFIAYICVPERGGENGRFHFHLLIFSPFFRKEAIERHWGKGWIHIRKVEDKDPANINNLYSYLIKYMGKNIDNKDMYTPGKKRFHSSRNIKRKVVAVKAILDNEEDVVLLSKHIAENCGVKAAFHWQSNNREIEIDTLSISPSMDSISRAADALQTLQ